MTAGGEDADTRLGANLRAHRERKGMTQAELAARMSAAGQGWHQSTVARAEAGRQSVRVSEAEALSRILGVSLDRLLWAGPEENAVALVDRAAAILHRSGEEAANAVAALHAARAGAKRTIEESRDSKYQRVRDACRGLEGELAETTLDAAIGEGAFRWERMSRDDGADA